MRIALIGQAAFGKDVLNALIKNGGNVVATFCPPDTAVHRIDPIKEASQSHNIPVYQYKRMRTKEAVSKFISLDVDLCVMAFVTDIVPVEIIEAPTFKTIQYHPSLLPEHRGPSSINWPIIKGKTKTGITIFWPDDGLDTGPILFQQETPIDQDDTLGTLYFDRLYPMGVSALVESVNLVRAGSAPRIDQNHSLATYEGWCRSKDAKIDWQMPVHDLYNLIRGCDPSPGANTTFKDDKVSFFRASVNPGNTNRDPGTVTDITSGSFTVAAKGGSISISRVQVNQMRKMSAPDFIEYSSLKNGDTFGS